MTKDGWSIFRVALPDGTKFTVAFKDGIMRIRKGMVIKKGDDHYWTPKEADAALLGEHDVVVLEVDR